MEYTRLGNTGLIVSRLAFGAMTFGKAAGPMAAISAKIARVNDDKLGNEIVARALDAGINHFNTADVYTGGNSERMLGAALGNRRKDVVISTKVAGRTDDAILHQGLSRQHILTAAEESLRRLGTDYIDVYLVHRYDPYTPMEETLEALDALVKSGKVRYVGFSNWNAWRAAKAVGLQERHGWARFRAAEMYYSLVGRDLEHEVVPFVQDAGIGVLVWSPLAGGLLSGKYTRENPKGDGGRLTSFDFLPYDKDKAYEVVDELQRLAKIYNATSAQVALAWLLSKPFVSSILIGANKVEQLNDNLCAVDLKISMEELRVLEALTVPTETYPNWFAHRFVDEPVQKALAAR